MSHFVTQFFLLKKYTFLVKKNTFTAKIIFKFVYSYNYVLLIFSTLVDGLDLYKIRVRKPNK